MKIKEIISQYRRDFFAIYECEHCNHTFKSHGYDDMYFHEEVIQEMVCHKCNKKADSTYRPLKTKYSEHEKV